MSWLANVNGYYLIAFYMVVAVGFYTLCVMAGRETPEVE